MLLVIDKSIAMNEGIVVDGGQALNDKRMLASLLIIKLKLMVRNDINR